MRPDPLGLLIMLPGARSGARTASDVAAREPRRAGRIRPRPLVFFALLLGVAHVGLATTRAHALCNIIPPAARSFPSTQGSVDRPIVAPGDEVEITLSACDAGPGFNSSPAANAITVTFLPAGDPQAVIPITSGIVVPPADCAGGAGPCLTLRFTMPSTTSATFPDGLAGPAEIRVVNGTTAAVVGPLSQPRPSDTTCDKQAETVFRQFTVLPAPNVFQTLIDNPATRVRAALDGSGSLLVPFDYRDVLPLGPAEPVAALLGGATTIDAFPSAPGVPIDIPDSSWVRSFTIDGRPVPPLLRATEAGNQVFGASDGAEGIVRVARSLGGAPPIFDLQSLRASNGRGPVIIPAGRWSVEPGAAVPLANLRSTGVAAAFARDESIEGNLNGAPFSADNDVNDDVVQIIDVATFTSTLTGMAASPTSNPIVGGAVVETGGELVALLESEAQQAGSDLNANGQPSTDDVLRVLTTTGAPLTPSAPAQALVGSPFPGIDRRPLAIDGSLVYFREPEVGFQGRSGFIEQGIDVAISRDGRFIVTTNPTAGASCGEVRVRRRDGESGTFLESSPGVRAQCGLTNGANGVAISPSSAIVYLAAPGANKVHAFRLGVEPDQISVGGGVSEKTLTDGVGGVDGLLGVNRLAITPATPDGTIFGPRVSLYALAPGENAITAFNVSENQSTAGVTLTFVKTLEDQPGCTPSATRGCIASFSDARNLSVSPDGKHVYVAVHGSSRIKGFQRVTNSAEITPIGEWIDGSNGGTLLGGAIDVAVSPDGRFVYALADVDDAITIFSRNATSGLLTVAGTVINGPGIEGLDQAKRVAVSPDGRALVVSNGTGRVAVFSRNTATGALGFNRLRGHGPSGIATANLAISPDSEHVYLMKNNQASGDVFSRESALRAFDASTGQTKPGLDGLNAAAKLASVSTGRAAWIRPTTVLGSPLTFVTLYDATSDTAQTLDGATALASKLALSSQILAVAAPESGIGDADGDGQTDDTLLVVATSNPSAAPTIVGVDALDLDATDVCAGGTSAGDACVTSADCPGGTCRGVAVASKIRAQNFDGGADTALTVYRHGFGGAVEVGRNVADFIVGGNLVAFRDRENGLYRQSCTDQNEITFDNDDADCTDLTMRVYDLKTGQTFDTRQSTIKCEQPGCEPGLPYKVLGDAVAFLTREADQGNEDLDGDGDADDTVVQIFSVRTGRTQIVKTRPGATVLPPLPTRFLGGSILFQERLESDVGYDVNEDGDQNDVVVLVDGDSDGDGVFDSSDLCVESSDPKQLDSDGDGLGNGCDPTPFCGPLLPSAPPVPPAAANACQDGLGRGMQTFVKSWAKAVVSCLDRIAAGSLSGDPDVVCRGNASGRGLVLPTDTQTLAKITRATELFRRTVESKCSDAQLGQLGACATSRSGVVTCATRRAAIASIGITSVAYGEVAKVTGAASLRCQKSIGKHALNYLTSVGGAMRSCLDRVNDGTIAGNPQLQCLGAETPLGATPPAHAQTRAQLDRAAAKLATMLANPCAGTVAAPLDACGDDAAGVGACARCTGWREAVGTIASSYGPRP